MRRYIYLLIRRVDALKGICNPLMRWNNGGLLQSVRDTAKRNSIAVWRNCLALRNRCVLQSALSPGLNGRISRSFLVVKEKFW